MFVDPYTIVRFIKKNPTRCNNVSKFYYSIFIRSSKRFEWHAAHHQEPKTALAASGVCLTTSTNYTSNNLPRYYEKPEAGSAVLGSWRRAVCRPKHVELHINVWNKNFDTLLHLVGFFSMNCSLLSSLQPATCPSTEPHQSVVILSSHLQLGLPSDRFP